MDLKRISKVEILSNYTNVLKISIAILVTLMIIDSKNIIPGNGATEIIYLLMKSIKKREFLCPGIESV